MFTICIQFSEEIGKLEDKVECANNALKADWDRWKQNMQHDMRSAFTNVADNNLRYYEEVKPFLIAMLLLTDYFSREIIASYLKDKCCILVHT